LAFFGVELKSKRRRKTIENPRHIGEHIRKRRFELKLLQSELAQMLGVCEDTITGWENGRSVPQIQFYPRLIQFLGYNPWAAETETLGGRIKLYRMEHGLSHKNLGKKLGVDASTVAAWEENEHVPNQSKRKIVEVLLHQKELL